MSEDFKKKYALLTEKEKVAVDKRIAKHGLGVNYETVLTKREIERIEKRIARHNGEPVSKKGEDIFGEYELDSSGNKGRVKVEKDTGLITLTIKGLTKEEFRGLANQYLVKRGKTKSLYEEERDEMMASTEKPCAVIDGINYYGDIKPTKEMIDKIMNIHKEKEAQKEMIKEIRPVCKPPRKVFGNKK